MNKFLSQSKRFLSKNASTILTCVGGVGVVATVVLAVQATPKALARVEEAKEEKGEDLTKFEIVKATATTYIPTVLVGVSTLACIFGANALNKRQQAGLMSAYALVDTSFKEYKKKVAELYGNEAEEVVREEIAKDKYDDYNMAPSDDTRLFYDEYSGRYFESTMEKVINAEYKINKWFSESSGVFLNEFYELLGLEKTDYGDFVGWSVWEVCESYGSSWIDFQHTTAILDDNLECTIISFPREPIYDFENY